MSAPLCRIRTALLRSTFCMATPISWTWCQPARRSLAAGRSFGRWVSFACRSSRIGPVSLLFNANGIAQDRQTLRHPLKGFLNLAFELHRVSQGITVERQFLAVWPASTSSCAFCSEISADAIFTSANRPAPRVEK